MCNQKEEPSHCKEDFPSPICSLSSAPKSHWYLSVIQTLKLAFFQKVFLEYNFTDSACCQDQDKVAHYLTKDKSSQLDIFQL